MHSGHGANGCTLQSWSAMWDDQSLPLKNLVITKGHNTQGLNTHTVALTPITYVDIVPRSVYLCYLKLLRIYSCLHCLTLVNWHEAMPGNNGQPGLARVSTVQTQTDFGCCEEDTSTRMVIVSPYTTVVY